MVGIVTAFLKKGKDESSRRHAVHEVRLQVDLA